MNEFNNISESLEIIKNDILEEGVLNLSKVKLKLLLENKELFEDFIVDAAEDILLNWDEYSIKMELRKNMTQEDILAIINKED